MSDADSDYGSPPIKTIEKPPRYKHRPRGKLVGKCRAVTFDARAFAELPLIEVYQLGHADFLRYRSMLHDTRALSKDEVRDLNAVGNKIKNREYARESRARTKNELYRLEEELGELTMCNTRLVEEGRQLQNKVSEMQKQNGALQQQVVDLCKMCASLHASVEDLQLQNQVLLAQMPLTFGPQFWYDQ